MCGRFVIQPDEFYEDLVRLVEEVEREQKTKTGEIYPTNVIPVITKDGDNTKVHLYKWGFPSFKGNGLIINARAETIEEKPMFRKAFQTKRCLVPSHGFYEWNQNADSKQKYHIFLKDQPVMYMAGIYNTYTAKDGNPYNAFCIITIAANAIMSTIHSRMPVIIAPEFHDSWLSNAPGSVDNARKLLSQYSDEMILNLVG